MIERFTIEQPCMLRFVRVSVCSTPTRNTKLLDFKWKNSDRLGKWPPEVTAPDTEIFSLLLVAGLCVAIGRQLYESNDLTQV